MSRSCVVAVVLSCVVGGPSAAALQGAGPGIAEERIVFGELPTIAVALDGFMWVLDRRGGTIAKVDPQTNEIAGEIDLSELGLARTAWDLEAWRGSLWFPAATRRQIVELDPDTGEIAGALRTRDPVSEIYPARGSFWFVAGSRDRVVLVGMDARTGKRHARIRLGPTNTHVSDVVAFDGSVWAVRARARHVAGTGRNPTSYVSASLWQIDPRSDEVVDRRPLGATYTRGAVNPVVGDVEVAERGLWMSRVHERRLLLVRPRDGRVLDVEPVGEFRLPWEIEVLDGEVWVGNLNRGEVARIDPETGERWFTDVAADTSHIATGFGSVWAPVVGGAAVTGEVVRLTPE